MILSIHPSVFNSLAQCSDHFFLLLLFSNLCVGFLFYFFTVLAEAVVHPDGLFPPCASASGECLSGKELELGGCDGRFG